MTDWNRRRALSRIVCVQGDLTREPVDAIVNAANESLRGGGGVDGAIHRAAGAALLGECIAKYPDGCPTGEARLTGGYGLPAQYVIHTPGPVYGDHDGREAELLASCHRESLRLGAEVGCVSVSFPAISCGVYGYPPKEAAPIAISTCVEAILDLAMSIEEVRFVLVGGEMLDVFASALDSLRSS